jgi:nucleotide-binding universal stress UspA family protein
VPVPAATPLSVAQELLEKEGKGHHRLLQQAADYAYRQGVPVRKLLQAARSVPAGIVAVAEERSGVGLILMGWQGQFATRPEKGHIVQSVLHGAKRDVAVLRSRPMEHLERILVPIGGGPHSRLALKLAWEIAQVVGAEVAALRIVRPESRSDLETEREVLRQIVEDRLGEAGEQVVLRVVEGSDIAAAILAEAEQGYDLLLIGASEEWFLKEMLFGSIPDRIADGASCSVLLVRKHEPTSVSWLRRRLKRIG